MVGSNGKRVFLAVSLDGASAAVSEQHNGPLKESCTKSSAGWDGPHHSSVELMRKKRAQTSQFPLAECLAEEPAPSQWEPPGAEGSD